VNLPVLVRPVAGRRDFTRFIDHPYERHAGDPHWIPPLRIGERERLQPKKNPFFEHADVDLFLAWRDGRVVGRIGAIDDRLHNATHHESTAMFGFFEADTTTTARALLETCERWAAARGRTCLRGPINPSLNDNAGLLVDGFDTDPMILMPHNPREYAAFIEAAGYRKAKDLFAWIYDIERQPPDVIARLAVRQQHEHGIAVRALNVDEFDREADRLRRLYCSAWERNWGFVPPTETEFRRIAHEMKLIFDPRCAVCAEHDGRMVACAVAIPDVNQALKGTGGRLFPLGLAKLLARRRYITQMRLLLLGVEPAYRPLGLYPLLLYAMHTQALGGPYRRIEFSWVLEDNRDINQPAERAGARRYKTYRIYEKALS
jgi:GNAT superfamily N-acetyltransferase